MKQLNFGGFTKEKIAEGMKAVFVKHDVRYDALLPNGNIIAEDIVTDYCSVDDDILYSALPERYETVIADAHYDKHEGGYWFNFDIPLIMHTKKMKKKQRIRRLQQTVEMAEAMLERIEYGVSGTWVDDFEGCGNPKVFPEFEEPLKHGDYYRKEHICCPYDNAVLFANCGDVDYSGGCYHRCGIYTIRYADVSIKKNILSRFIKNLKNGMYKKGRKATPIITEDELKSVMQRKRTEEERRAEATEYEYRQWQKTLDDKRNQLIVFHGNNLNPLPQEIFTLWNRLESIHETNMLRRPCISYEANKDYNEICGFDGGHYTSCDCGFDHVETYDMYPWNSTVAVSLYYDFQIKRELFCIMFLTNGEDIDTEYFQVRNAMIMTSNAELMDTYARMEKLRADNKDKWKQIYKTTAYQKLNDAISFHNDLVCETCLYTDHCDRVVCFKPEGIQSVKIPERQQFKINLHILEPCNYRCRHCFAHFDNDHVLPVNVWKHIVDNCADAIYTHEFNIAGGEPFLYKDLDELVRYIHSTGADVSIITNGFLMTEKWIADNAKYYKTIGFSVDSFDEQTCIMQGRCTAGKEVLNRERLGMLCGLIKKHNPKCRIKINTVVTSLNMDECLAGTIAELPVDRWKIFKMDVFKTDSFDNSDIQVTDEQYENFINANLSRLDCVKNDTDKDKSGYCKTESGMEVVVEKDVNASYLMVDANGHLVDDSLNDSYVRIINCATEDFIEGLKKISFNQNLYFSRYGNSEESDAEISGGAVGRTRVFLDNRRHV